MKRCRHCNILKPKDKFHVGRKNKDGLQAWCKDCNKLRNNNKQYDSKYYLEHKTQFINRTNKHNKTKDSGLYSKYWSMKRRCKYPSQEGYKYYGGKGIIVEWETYQEFKHDMYRQYLKHQNKYGARNTTIDRIDPTKNYCKENCRWATYKIQANNKTNSLHNKNKVL